MPLKEEESCPHAFRMPDEETIFCRSRLVVIHSGLRFVTESQCRLCETKSQPHREVHILDAPELNPSLIQRGKNFYKAASKQIRRGYKVEKEVSDVREKVCDVCPVYHKTLKYCTDRKCGCKSTLLGGGMKTKWEWSTSACPKALWKPAIKNQTIESYIATCKDPRTGKPFKV